MDELKQIVQRMIDAGESEDNIKMVIERYNEQDAQQPEVDPAITGTPEVSEESELIPDNIDPFEGVDLPTQQEVEIQKHNESQAIAAQTIASVIPGLPASMVSSMANFASTTADLLAGVAKTPEILTYAAINGLANVFDPEMVDTPEKKKALMAVIDSQNSVDDLLESGAEAMDPFKKQYRGGITELAGEGDYAAAAEQTVDQVIGAVPSVLATMTGVGGLAAIGVSSFGNKFEEEFDEDPEASTWGLLGSALASASYEVASEAVTRGIVKRAGLAFGAGGEKAAAKVAQNAAKRILGEFGLEGSSEALAELATTFTDAAILGKKVPSNLIPRLLDTFLVGGIMGGGVGTIGTLNGPAKAYVENRVKPEEQVEKEEAIANEINHAEKAKKEATTPEEVGILNELIKRKTTELETDAQKNSEIVQDLEPQEYKEIINAKENISEAQSVLDNESSTDEAKDAAEQIINEERAVATETYMKPVLVKEIEQKVKLQNEKHGEKLEKLNKTLEDINITRQDLAAAEKPNPKSTKKLNIKEADTKKEIEATQKTIDDNLELPGKFRKSKKSETDKIKNEIKKVDKTGTTAEKATFKDKANEDLVKIVKDGGSTTGTEYAFQALKENNQGRIKQFTGKILAAANANAFTKMSKQEARDLAEEYLVSKIQSFDPSKGTKFSTHLGVPNTARVGEIIRKAGLEDKFVQDSRAGYETRTKKTKQKEASELTYTDRVRLQDEKATTEARERLVDLQEQYDKGVLNDEDMKREGYYKDRKGNWQIQKGIATTRLDEFAGEEGAYDALENEISLADQNYVPPTATKASKAAVKEALNLSDGNISVLKEKITDAFNSTETPDVTDATAFRKYMNKAVAKPILSKIDQTFGKNPAEYLFNNTDQIFKALPGWALKGDKFSGLFADGNPEPQQWADYFGAEKNGTARVRALKNALADNVIDNYLDEALEEGTEGYTDINFNFGELVNPEKMPTIFQDQMAEVLGELWPDVQVSMNPDLGVQWSGRNLAQLRNVHGFATWKGGRHVVWLNANNATPDTALHEFGHLWLNAIKEKNPDLYRKGEELIRKSDYFKQIEENPAYSNLDFAGKLNEAMARGIGIEGTKLFENKTRARRWDSFVKQVWKSIQDLFALTETVDPAMKLGDFFELATADILSGGKVLDTKIETPKAPSGVGLTPQQRLLRRKKQMHAGNQSERLLSKTDFTTLRDAINNTSDEFANKLREQGYQLPQDQLVKPKKESHPNTTEALADVMNVVTQTVLAFPQGQMRDWVVRRLLRTSHDGKRPTGFITNADAIVDTIKKLELSTLNEILPTDQALDAIRQQAEKDIKHATLGKQFGDKYLQALIGVTGTGTIAATEADVDILNSTKTADKEAKRELEKKYYKEFIRTFNKVIQQGDFKPGTANKISQWLIGEQGAIGRKSATLVGESKTKISEQGKTRPKTSTDEHVLPANDLLKRAIAASQDPNVDFDSELDYLFENYVQVDLSFVDDKALDQAYKDFMPESFGKERNIFNGKIPDSFIRYFNDRVFLNPFNIVYKGKTIAEHLDLDPSLEEQFTRITELADGREIAYNVMQDTPGAKVRLKKTSSTAEVLDAGKQEQINFVNRMLTRKFKDAKINKILEATKKQFDIKKDRLTDDELVKLAVNLQHISNQEILGLGEHADLKARGKEASKGRKKVSDKIDELLSDRYKIEGKVRTDEVTDILKKRSLGKKIQDTFKDVLKGTSNKDFYSMMYDLLPTNNFKDREAAKKWQKDNIIDPLESANNEYIRFKWEMQEGFSAIMQKYDMVKEMSKNSGVKIGQIELTVDELIKTYMHIKDPSLHEQLVRRGVTTTKMKEIVEAVKAKDNYAAFAEEFPSVFSKHRAVIDQRLKDQGLEGLTDTALDAKELAPDVREVLELAYDGHIPSVVKYTPFTAEGDEDIDFTDNPGDFFTVMSGNLKKRTGTGEYKIGSLVRDVANYTGDHGPLRTAAFLDFSKTLSSMMSKDNQNKMRLALGEKWVHGMKDATRAIVTGEISKQIKDPTARSMYNWVRNSVANIMFWNTRSAILQLISAANYMEGDPFAWAQNGMDYMTNRKLRDDILAELETTKWLKNRKQTGATDPIFDDVLRSQSNTAYEKAWQKFTAQGYKLTKWGDAIAIQAGGMPFIVGRVKAGLTVKDAVAEFISKAEESQQSARPERLSVQQRNTFGKLILSFLNTPLQYGRVTSRALKDATVPGTPTSVRAAAVRKAAYYTAFSAGVFGGLQQMISPFSDDDEDKGKFWEGLLKSMLSYMGVQGKVASAVYDVASAEAKGKKPDVKKAVIDAIPALSTKVRHAEIAAGTKKVYEPSEGLLEDLPLWVVQAASAAHLTGVPMDRAIYIAAQIDDFVASDLGAVDRVLRLLGWSRSSIDEGTSPLNKLGEGEMGQAFKDGTIEVDPNLSPVDKAKTIAHEKQHVEDMKAGKLTYDDNSLTWNGKKFKRKNGKIAYNGQWHEEGSSVFPWEQVAEAAESPLKNTDPTKGPREGTPEWDAAVREGKDFNIDWYSNPVAAELFKEQAPRFKGGAADRFKTIEDTHVTEGPASGAVAEYWRNSFPEEGQHKHNVEINPDARGISADLVAHETTHAAGFDYDLGKVAKSILGDSKRKDSYGRYLNNPDEAYANLQELRQILGLRPDQRDLTPEQLEKLAEEKGNDDVKAYIKNFGIENVAKAHNKVASTFQPRFDPSALNQGLVS